MGPRSELGFEVLDTISMGLALRTDLWKLGAQVLSGKYSDKGSLSSKAYRYLWSLLQGKSALLFQRKHAQDSPPVLENRPAARLEPGPEATSMKVQHKS